MTPELLTAMIDSLKDPYVFADTEHVIRYMSSAAIKHYEKWGGAKFIGASLFDCHNEESCRVMREIYAAMQEGEDERLISVNEKRREFMRAVRNSAGQLLGYTERYEWLSDNI